MVRDSVAALEGDVLIDSAVALSFEVFKELVSDNLLAGGEYQLQVGAINDIERYRADISAIRSGSITLIPSSVAHAEAMLLIAERYLNDRRK